MEKLNYQLDSLTQTTSTTNILVWDTLKIRGNIRDSMLVSGIVDFGIDTVMVLKKPQAINISNAIISQVDTRNRFVLSLQRHDALIDLWIKGEERNTKQESLMLNKNAQLETCDEQKLALLSENKRLRDVSKKVRNTSLFNGLGIGLVIGAIGTSLIFVAAN